MPTTMAAYPNEQWMRHLRRGDLVFLVKENEFAEVEWPFEPPMGFSISGRIGIRRRGSWLENWYIRENGRGNDSSQCMMPVEGHLAETMGEAPRSDQRELIQRLESLESEVARLRQIRQAVREVAHQNLEFGSPALLDELRAATRGPDPDYLVLNPEWTRRISPTVDEMQAFFGAEEASKPEAPTPPPPPTRFERESEEPGDD